MGQDDTAFAKFDIAFSKCLDSTQAFILGWTGKGEGKHSEVTMVGVAGWLPAVQTATIDWPIFVSPLYQC